MNKHYKTLELHKIMDMLAEQAGNDETLRMISELEPVTDIDKVRTELKKTGQVLLSVNCLTWA